MTKTIGIDLRGVRPAPRETRPKSASNKVSNLIKSRGKSITKKMDLFTIYADKIELLEPDATTVHYQTPRI